MIEPSFGKRKEALVIALYEKGKTYREIMKEAGVSPNTVKSILNRVGLDQTTTLSSRAYELFSQGKNQLDVAKSLNLQADKAIDLHLEYMKLIGAIEFIRVYLPFKDDPWPTINFVRLIQSAGMNKEQILELLEIAKGYLPRVKLEYDILKAEINALEAEKCNSVRVYQQFVDQNVKLKKREGELVASNNELETKKVDLQKSFDDLLSEFRKLQHCIKELEVKRDGLLKSLDEPLSKFQDNKADHTNPYLGVKQDEVLSINDVFIPPLDKSTNYHRNEIETSHYSHVEPSSKTIIFDTKEFQVFNSPQDQQE